ncbi:cytochrome ubiquinol oxidase subunit I [Fictibacillus nanhaiensis]|jgi:cytochrome bd ubiquinol oxidase subunit I|uniref:cytochrome ubiquinol oxidase subunit I n=1 Tax=Fictibacillus nanhaiensis TaxID=742169 RepID=UPI0020407E7B|nr:cytochrome ubiquinol oxidase subunit I [Fictibacillus nanhaiensis]MCM3730972.1 cytochrome ubiquinol oxidase subunit I [Fictibacillus nanhaiensis]
MDTVILARAFFGTSLGFHIIFATLGVGLPLMIVIAEIIHQVKGDNDYAIMAKRWTKAFAVLLGVAIPSGTIVGVQLSLLWPGFMEIVGKVISLPFQIEIFAFFLEALFMSIYVYAADRLPRYFRLISVFFVAFGAVASAILITAVNTWMNTPDGFKIKPDGTIYDVHPWDAFFNPSFVSSAFHVAITAYMTGAFAVASVAAFKLLKKRSDRERSYHLKSLFMSLAVAFVMSFVSALSGHHSAQILHQYSPEKLAAAEGLFETQRYAPLAIGGYTDPETEEVKYGIEIPWALSWLAAGKFDTEVKGLYEFPRETWPPFYVHTLFNLMVGIGTLLLGLAGITLLYWWFFIKKRGKPFPKWLLWSLVLSGPLSMLGIEFGWVFSCSGRQPWTIYRVQTTAEAATRNENLGILFLMFLLLYALLSVLTILILTAYFKRNPVSKDMDKIYG